MNLINETKMVRKTVYKLVKYFGTFSMLYDIGAINNDKRWENKIRNEMSN